MMSMMLHGRQEWFRGHFAISVLASETLKAPDYKAMWAKLGRPHTHTHTHTHTHKGVGRKWEVEF